MLKMPKIFTLCLLSLSLISATQTHAAFGDENFYESLKVQYIPEEIQKLFPKTQPIIAHAIGHLNDDEYWDAIVITTTNEALRKAKPLNILPTNKTVHLLIGNEKGFSKAFSHAYLFQDGIEPADSVYNGIVDIQNHKISKKIHHTYDLFGDDKSEYTATGGFEIKQNFGDNNSSNIGFIWDKDQKTWIYDGSNVAVSIENGVHLVSLSVDESTQYKIADFYLGHPKKGDKVHLDGQSYIDEEDN